VKNYLAFPNCLLLPVQNNVMTVRLSSDVALLAELLELLVPGDWCLRLALRTPSGACHTGRRSLSSVCLWHMYCG